MKHCIFLYFLLFSGILSAANLMDFVPRRASQIVRIDVQAVSAWKIFQDDLSSVVSRQTKIDGLKDNPFTMKELVDEIIIVTPVLTEEDTFVFVKTRVPEKMFCQKLEELFGARHISVEVMNRTEKRISLPAMRLSFGPKSGKRTLAFAFLAENMAVFAENSLEKYWNCKIYGLSKQIRQSFWVPNFLAVGRLEMEPRFLQEHPFLPPFQRLVYSFARGPAESLQIKATVGCGSEEAANRVQMQVQQYVMMGGIILNQVSPELMQEWINLVKISRKNNEIFVQGDFSRSFLNAMMNASGQLTENTVQSGKDGNKR